MNEEIVRCINQQLTVMRQAYTHGQRDVTDTNVLEIQAFFAVLYLAGVKKGNHLNIKELWSNDSTCPELFSAVMSKRRFQMLVQGIRFDDKMTRAQRKRHNNLAPIRHILDQFVQKCEDAYRTSEYDTIDEMLDAFWGMLEQLQRKNGSIRWSTAPRTISR